MNTQYPHDAFCTCGHWNVKHRTTTEGTVNVKCDECGHEPHRNACGRCACTTMSLVSERCGFCECVKFEPQVRNGAILTPSAEKNMYDRAMRGEL